MRSLLVLCSLVAFALASTVPPPQPPPPRPQFIAPHPERGCLYALGRCVKQCPENTHAYGSGCSNVAVSQRTCDDPVSHEMGNICDLSRCDCDEPFVLDKASDKCVLVKDCPKKVP